MNKQALIDQVAKAYGNDKKAAKKAVEVVLGSIVTAVTDGEKVSVTGFGSIRPVERRARMARNPQNGERVWIKKKIDIRFRPGTAFREIANGQRSVSKALFAVRKLPKYTLTPRKSES